MDGWNRWMDRMVWDGDAMRWMVLPPLQALLISLWHSNATKASEDELNKRAGKRGCDRVSSLRVA